MRKKILVDIYLAFNIGDDMFLDYLANTFPEVDFVPFHAGNNYDTFFSKYKNISKFPYTLFDKIKSRIFHSKLKDYKWMSQHFDGILFLGGGIFREEDYWKEVYTYRSDITQAFKENEKPVWIAGSNFGPYSTSSFLEAYKDLFNKMNKVTFRDHASYNLFASNAKISYAPDVLWSYNLPKSDKKEKTLGISVIDPGHKQGYKHTKSQYIEAHRKLCESFLTKGYRIKIFSFCENEGDLDIAKSIADGLVHVDVINYSGNIDEFLLEIGSCSKFVAARFHANIIAMKFQTEFIPIVYSNKTENLLSDLGFSKPFINLENIEELNNADFLTIDQQLVKDLAVKSRDHLSGIF